MIKKVLVIPPLNKINARIRLLEIGRILSRNYDVYLLRWNEPKDKSFFNTSVSCFNNFFKPNAIYEENGVLLAQYPFFYKPLFMAKSRNAIFLEKFISEFKINTVINSNNYFFPTPFSRNYQHIFDLNDLAELNSASLSQTVSEFLRKESQKADTVIASSLGLTDYARSQFNRKASFLPDGVYLSDFKLDFEEVKKIRAAFNLLNKYVISFIGYLDENIDYDFMIDLFLELKKKNKGIAFMVVGEGPGVGFLKTHIRDDNFIIVTSIPQKQLPSYFFAANIGMLPYKKNSLHDFYFPKEIIEYSAAKKIILSLPLPEVINLKFPNVITAELKVNEWINAIERSRMMRWEPSWDNLVSDYDWKKIADKFSALIDSKKN